MDAFLLAYPMRRPPAACAAEEAARLLIEALARHGIVADVNHDHDRDRVLVSVCHGLVAAVTPDHICWRRACPSRRGAPLYTFHTTTDRAAAELAKDYALLNRIPTMEEQHGAPV
ncbi:hypothetical protein C1I98_21570 [Spongiactinospora gelatinilytica]|uniref:Uncharacterized protein n=1 Tax=Spongiactinospora gelatinilytica TaxID=2666298 RepID=A0A2W2GMF7_9ACTN|nr:hypothetical protein [Spongiactinospora gelatinilytica]PZG41215.1 hypothetical protein C1I98_21570 [Spongiactinospora gelatinilytica]